MAAAMLETLREILSENWQWRQQIAKLAVIDVRKTCRGAVLGWVWLFVKPLTYIGVFWFALDMGLRASQGTGGSYPYILWLTAGLVPWFFIQDMIGAGANVYQRYPFLVNRIRFPLSAISSFHSLAQFFIYLALMALVLVACLVGGVRLTVYALQLIPVALLMLLFFICYSIMVSPLSALSKDFCNLLKALSTPLFWLSGIIYNTASLPFAWLQAILAFNPITFFVTAHRAALCEQYWIWDRPDMLIPFIIVFVATVFCAVLCYKNLRKDVADVL